MISDTDTPMIDLLMAHQALGVIAIAACVFVSLCLIARLWVLRRSESVLSRLVWSFVLLLPILGWLFYAAFYRAPERSEHEGHVEHGQAAWGSDPGIGHD